MRLLAVSVPHPEGLRLRRRGPPVVANHLVRDGLEGISPTLFCRPLCTAGREGFCDAKKEAEGDGERGTARRGSWTPVP